MIEEGAEEEVHEDETKGQNPHIRKALSGVLNDEPALTKVES